MQYKLTEVEDICNAGANVTVTVFDMLYEMQDYIEDKTSNMSDYEKELYMSNIKIDEL